MTCYYPDYNIITEDTNNAFIETIDGEKVEDSHIDEIYELLDVLSNTNEEDRKNSILILATKDKGVKYDLYENHAYYVTNVKIKNSEDSYDAIFEINDPHCTSCKLRKISLSQVLESMNGVFYLKFD